MATPDFSRITLSFVLFYEKERAPEGINKKEFITEVLSSSPLKEEDEDKFYQCFIKWTKRENIKGTAESAISAARFLLQVNLPEVYEQNARLDARAFKWVTLWDQHLGSNPPEIVIELAKKGTLATKEPAIKPAKTNLKPEATETLPVNLVVDTEDFLTNPNEESVSLSAAHLTKPTMKPLAVYLKKRTLILCLAAFFLCLGAFFLLQSHEKSVKISIFGSGSLNTYLGKIDWPKSIQIIERDTLNGSLSNVAVSNLKTPGKNVVWSTAIRIDTAFLLQLDEHSRASLEKIRLVEVFIAYDKIDLLCSRSLQQINIANLRANSPTTSSTCILINLFENSGTQAFAMNFLGISDNIFCKKINTANKGIGDLPPLLLDYPEKMSFGRMGLVDNEFRAKIYPVKIIDADSIITIPENGFYMYTYVNEDWKISPDILSFFEELMGAKVQSGLTKMGLRTNGFDFAQQQLADLKEISKNTNFRESRILRLPGEIKIFPSPPIVKGN